MVLDQTLKAIAHFLVRPKDVHASAVGKDDLGGVGATHASGEGRLAKVSFCVKS
jgi:hypothetical protein